MYPADIDYVPDNVESPLEWWNLPSTEGRVVHFVVMWATKGMPSSTIRACWARCKVWLWLSRGSFREVPPRSQDPPSFAKRRWSYLGKGKDSWGPRPFTRLDSPFSMCVPLSHEHNSSVVHCKLPYPVQTEPCLESWRLWKMMLTIANTAALVLLDRRCNCSRTRWPVPPTWTWKGCWSCCMRRVPLLLLLLSAKVTPLRPRWVQFPCSRVTG